MESQNNHQNQISNSDNSDFTSSEKEEQEKEEKQISNLNKQNPALSKELLKNKLNTNSSLNAKEETNTSNEQKKKEQSESSNDEDIISNEEDENEIFKEYDMINDMKLQAMDDIKNINERIKNNKLKIEELKKTLIELKEEKKKKENDIMNLLSNKESLEEVYKNQLYSLNNSNSKEINNSIFNDNTTLNNDINNLNNLMNDNSLIHLSSNHNITIIDNEILNTEEENIKISLKDIKESDPNKYSEQVINMFEDVFKKKDEAINNSISDIIKNSYDLFINNYEETNEENNSELPVNNFFSKISLFIANQNGGKFYETKINILLKYLLKINYINTRLAKFMKFVNKKYKERKKEINDLISFLEKKNLSLLEKIKQLENDMKEYDENKMFFDNNDNEDLSHDVEIEYEDGLDKDVEINYEDDINDDKDNELEKQNEMMDKGMNPYNKQPIYKKIEKKIEPKKIKQIIVKDNDESEDKYLNEFLENEGGKKNKNIIKIKSNNINTNTNNNINTNNTNNNVIIKKNNKINTNNNIIIKKNNNIKNNINNNINNKNNINNNINNKNNINNNKNNISNNINNNIINKSFEREKKIPNIQNNINKTSNIINLDKNKRFFPTPQHHVKKTEEEINNLTTIEKDHYNRVQRIMNSGPKYGIFGVNKYNPENSGAIYTSNKKAEVPKSSNKIDKTVKIESRQNHNFIGIINMTKVVPVKKKKKENNRKSQEIKEEENEGGIKIINLEQDFNKEEGKEDEKILTNNNTSFNKNKNEMQGYYLNIINPKKEKNDNINIKEKKEEEENKDRIGQTNNLKLNYKKSYKSTRNKELNLEDNDSKKRLIKKVDDSKNTNKNINNNLNDNSTSNNNINKRAFSISESQKEENNNDGYKIKYQANKVIMINNTNNSTSPKGTFKRRFTKIPISKITGIGGKNYNLKTYENVNNKAGKNIYNLNKNKK